MQDSNLIPKYDILVSLFSKIGTKHPVGFVLEKTGIKTVKSLKTACWMFRSEKFTPKERLLNLRFKFGFLIRKKF